jgi:hypothetical protein
MTVSMVLYIKGDIYYLNLHLQLLLLTDDWKGHVTLVLVHRRRSPLTHERDRQAQLWSLRGVGTVEPGTEPGGRVTGVHSGALRHQVSGVQEGAEIEGGGEEAAGDAFLLGGGVTGGGLVQEDETGCFWIGALIVIILINFMSIMSIISTMSIISIMFKVNFSFRSSLSLLNNQPRLVPSSTILGSRITGT